MNRQNSIRLLTEGSVRKKILFYAMPIFIGNLFQQLYNTADALIVGNFVSQSALAAVSSVSSLLNLFIGFFVGFASGASIIIAHNIGAGRHEETVKAVHTAFALGIVLSVILTVLGTALSPWMLTIMGTPHDVYPLAIQYTRIYFAGSSALILYNVLVGILQAGGDSHHPLYYLIASSLTNIFADLLLIAVFHMGVKGAAIATVGSEALSAILCLIRLLRENSDIALHFSRLAIHPDVLKQIIHYGIPTGLQGSIIDVSNVMIQSYINSFGTSAAAGIGAYTKIEGFMFLPVTAFSLALTTFISQNEGAREKERVRQGVRFGINTCCGMVELIGALLFFTAPALIRAFNSDPDVVYYGAMRARTCAFFYGFLAFSHIVSAICRGEGKPVMPMTVMMICWCAIRVAVLLTVGQAVHDIRLANWLYPVTWSISTVIFAIWLKRMNLYTLFPER